jgi:serine/threonine-protein phosphatase 6 regulatory ankyrin repeat subunit B
MTKNKEDEKIFETLKEIIETFNSSNAQEQQLAKFKEILAANPKLCMAGQFCDQNIMHLAVDNNCKQIIEIILELAPDKKAVVNLQDDCGDTPLHQALRSESRSNIDIIELLLKNDADIKIKNEFFQTPFLLMVLAERLDALKVLFANPKVDVNERDADGRTVLYLSIAKEKNPKITEFLLQNGADVNSEKPEYLSLHQAIITHNDIAFNLILNGNNIINQQDNERNTALHIATKNEYFAVMKVLIQKGAHINMKNNEGQTPLHIAVSKKYFAGMEFLLLNGANVNKKNRRGQTALHIASELGYDVGVELLLDNGADPNIKDRYNDMKPIEYYTVEDKIPPTCLTDASCEPAIEINQRLSCVLI